MGRLDGKVAVITGAAGGIGLATAGLFLREGAAGVMLVDREEAGLRRHVELLGPKAAFCVADVTNPEATQKYVAETVSRFGGIDVLFANAGTEGTVAPVSELTVEAFDHVYAVNVRGVFLAIKYALPELTKRKGGSIVITSSVAGLLGSPGLSAYVMSKHALVGLMRSVALEAAPLGVRVNSVHPGPIDNRMMRGIEGQIAPAAADAVKAGFVTQIPWGRYGKNEEIAQLALFLASDDASYCTGSVFVADGGFTAH